ncbi:MAG TPA: SigB/SigF/SigG family RNA polymerase sigma factor [Solirubrobacteraceae bacterium]|nr:SigB/SigF/SigG family RNA polymerase sigma factor [Solirubrobacteraceae bacterium]
MQTNSPSAPSRALPRSRCAIDELFHRWQVEGDVAAREELVLRYQPLARRLARRYMGAREPLDDLLQVANLGLVNAIDRFDPSHGTAFASFAVPTILGELKRYFRDCGWAVHVTRGAQEMALAVNRATERLSARSGRAPTAYELAQYLEWSLDDVLDALATGAAHHAASLEAPCTERDGEGDAATLGESLGWVDPGFESVNTLVSVAAAARELSERERRVLRLRFVEDLTQTQIAEAIGVSQMQVSRLLRAALVRLAQLMDNPTPGPG